MMPKNDQDPEKKIKVKVVEEHTIDSVPPESSTTIEDQTVGFDTPLTEEMLSPEGKNETSFITLILAFLGGFLIGALLIGGIFYFKTTIGETSEPTPEAQETSVPTTESTPEPQVNLSEYKVQALNGSGTAGEALKVQGLLEAAGFKDVKAGNASAYDFKETEIAMKASVPESVFAEIEKALSGYKVTKVDTLKDTSDYDIVITIGSTKAD